MKCPKCQAELASEAAMCPKCGAPTERPEQAHPSTSLRESPQPKSKLKFAYISGAVLAVVIIAAILAILMLRGKPITQVEQPIVNSEPSIANAPPTANNSGPSIVTAPPTTAPGPPTDNTPPKTPAPPEVVAYLEFVKDIEARRHALLKDTARAVTMASTSGQAQGMLDMINMAMDDSQTTRPKQATAVQTELDTHIASWYQLVRQFDSKPAPQECNDFSGNYRRVLTTEAAGMVQVLTIFRSIDWSSVDSMSNSLNQLQKMKSDPNLQGNIDKAVETSDAKLTTLCSQYDMKKPFDVQKEQSGGSIIGP